MDKNSTLRKNQASRSKSLRQLLTQKQKDDIKKAFDHFDQKGAGSIKKKELKVILRALGFDPTHDELEQIVRDHCGEQVENPKDAKDASKEEITIDFQEFMDIMLTKIEEKIDDKEIMQGFKKIAGKSGKDKDHIYAEDIELVAAELEEKLSKEEIDEMLTEAIQMGKLLNKDEKKTKKDDKKEEEEGQGEEESNKKNSTAKCISRHDFSAILTWENK